MKLESQGGIIKKSEANLDEAGVQTQLASDNIEKLQSLTGNARPSFLKKRKDYCNLHDGESRPRDFHAASLDDPATNDIWQSWSPAHALRLKYQFEETNEDTATEEEIGLQM